MFSNLAKSRYRLKLVPPTEITCTSSDSSVDSVKLLYNASISMYSASPSTKMTLDDNINSRTLLSGAFMKNLEVSSGRFFKSTGSSDELLRKIDFLKSRRVLIRLL